MSEQTRFEIAPRGPFSLAAASRFLCAFLPAAESSAASGDQLAIGFRLDESFEAVGVSLVQRAGGEIAGEVTGTRDVERAQAQVARILSLDGDGEAFAAVGQRDPVIGALQRRLALRPVCFGSPYEAAVWGVIGQRLRMPQAAVLKRRLCELAGATVEVGGDRVLVVPSPEVLRGLEEVPGLPAEKLHRLRDVARAAREGQLDAARLRALPVDEARDLLRRIRGVGPWTAAHIHVRGAATQDVLPTEEPRFRRAVQQAYALPGEPDDATLVRLGDGWRPFRTWVAVLLVAALARSPARPPAQRGATKSVCWATPR